MKNVVRKLGKRNRKKQQYIRQEDAMNGKFLWPDGSPINGETELLSLLLPPSVKEFYRLLEEELDRLCGPKGVHTNDPNSRWSRQKGSIYLGGQQVGIEYQRVVKSDSKRAIPLAPYTRFQNPSMFDQKIFADGLRKVSQRDYKHGIPQIAGAFGFSSSTVGRSWKRSSKKKFLEMMNRDIGGLDIVAVFIDGKRYKSSGVVIALGVSVAGKKHVLGIYQADTENSTSCLGLLDDMEKRGLRGRGMVFIVDGGSGLNKALEGRYCVDNPEKREAVRLRCYQHKARNLEEHLKKDDPSTITALTLFNGVRYARDLPEALLFSDKLEAHLKRINLSALKSYREAKADLLMLHKLDLNPLLKKFFATTNPIESLNSMTEENMRRVKYWRSSEQFQRWCATMGLDAERRMRRVKGWKGLEALKQRAVSLCRKSDSIKAIDKAQVAA